MSLIGVSEAAKLLHVAPSTISRYVAQHAELNRSPGGKTPLIDLAELQRHRGDNVNALKSRNHAGELFDAPGHDEPDLPPSQPSSPLAPTSGAGEYSRHKADREGVLATEARIRLERALGQLVSRAAVDSELAELGRLVRDGLAQRNADLAERLAVIADPVAIRALLDEADTTLLTGIADVLDQPTDPGEDIAAA